MFINEFLKNFLYELMTTEARVYMAKDSSNNFFTSVALRIEPFCQCDVCAFPLRKEKRARYKGKICVPYFLVYIFLVLRFIIMY